MNSRLTVTPLKSILTSTSATTDRNDRSQDVVAEKIYLAAAAARQYLSIELSRHIQPASRYCFDMCDEIPKYLDSGYIVESKPTYKNKDLEHQFLIIVQNGKQFLVDPTYLQFVPEQYRSSLPSVMIIRLTNRTDLIKELRSFKIPDHLFLIWTSSVKPSWLLV